MVNTKSQEIKSKCKANNNVPCRMMTYHADYYQTYHLMISVIEGTIVHYIADRSLHSRSLKA